jgi:carbon storage regulator CsrA
MAAPQNHALSYQVFKKIIFLKKILKKFYENLQGGRPMLVLAMEKGDSLKIGENIVLKYHKLDGAQVSLAIDAPREIPVSRVNSARKVKQRNERLEKERALYAVSK